MKMAEFVSLKVYQFTLKKLRIQTCKDVQTHACRIRKYYMICCLEYYHKNNYWDRYVSAISADPDQTALEQSDQGLHALPFRLHL